MVVLARLLASGSSSAPPFSTAGAVNGCARPCPRLQLHRQRRIYTGFRLRTPSSNTTPPGLARPMWGPVRAGA